MHKLLFILLLAFGVAFGANADNDRVDPHELDFGTNLEMPEVPHKVSADIVDHMSNIKKALQKHGLNVEMDRGNEIVDIIIPCSDFFLPNDTVVKAKGAEKLRLLADLLKYPTMYKLVVAVYSDDTGEPEYCDNLTMTRANAIYECLVEVANDDDINVIPYGLGADDPRVENNSISNRASNRRVEIFIIPEWQMIDTARSGKLKKK